MGLLYGEYGGRSDGFEPGGASYETGFCPHGGGYCSEILQSSNQTNGVLTPVSYEVFKAASEAELGAMRVHENTIGEYHSTTLCFANSRYHDPAFMFESSMMFTLTDYAMKRSGKLHG